MAGKPVAWFDLDQFRHLPLAPIPTYVTAGREATTWRQVVQSRRDTWDGDKVCVGILYIRKGLQQSLGIWMLWVIEDVITAPEFHNLATVHHEYVVTHLCYHP
jgi:hypothetical protein